MESSQPSEHSGSVFCSGRRREIQTAAEQWPWGPQALSQSQQVSVQVPFLPCVCTHDILAHRPKLPVVAQVTRARPEPTPSPWPPGGC